MPSYRSFLRDLGARIRDVRRRRGWSQEELAHVSGLSRTFMGTVELGRKAASLATVHRIAEALGVPVVELFLPSNAAGRDIVARIEAMLTDRRRTLPELRKAEDLVSAFLRKP
ncbi:MAG: helix-turn-helix transcriptional regulator [Planctomycetes bacterium]|nr:helix-turn-helix transcriptional regulator [Planctomycetota bacterium]